MYRSARLALVLGVLAPPTVIAQTDAVRKTEAEVANYRLSMKKLWQIVEVQRDLNALLVKDPELFELADQENEARIKAGKPPTLRERATQLESRPPIRAVFAEAGTTPLDWLTATEAMGNAGVSLEIVTGRLDSRSGPPPGTEAEKANVTLLRQNEAEWRKILAELERLGDEIANMPE
ncbi:MAG TPA: hypothetical protein VG500_03805 [Gemmatimonadales bacterium]|jgi:hypothetical protein|nr:hypothetical protein [Gemmatimonadales bacterium]